MLTRLSGARAAAVLASLGPYREMLEPQRWHLLSFLSPHRHLFKVVGTGSVGLRDYCIYLEGNGPADPLFLQIKEETASAYALWLPDALPPAHNGQRVAEGQRAMQIQTDPFLRLDPHRQPPVSRPPVSTITRVPSKFQTWQALISKPMLRSAASCSPAAMPVPATRRSSLAI